ncbi:IS110 family transposase ISCaa7 [anaerobic digester metagenome]
MDFKETIGIDVSKPFIDAAIHTARKHRRFKNTAEGFCQMLLWVSENTNVKRQHTLFAFEHTGLYSLPLSAFLSERHLSYVLIPGLELKRSMGIARGKDDRMDAKAIALYAYRRREEVTPYTLPSKRLLELRKLLSLREKLVKQRTGFKATNTEIKGFLTRTDNAMYFAVHEAMIKALNQQILAVERQLELVIQAEEPLKRMFDLIVGIKGVGTQTALFMIAFTNGFTLFPNFRKFASYAGIAPFPYQSGISIKGKSQVHCFANKKFKSLLSSCATIAIRCNPEMRMYYQRRISEGKGKMSTLNIIRNKLLSRIFAVVQRGTPYVDTMAYAS